MSGNNGYKKKIGEKLMPNDRAKGTPQGNDISYGKNDICKKIFTELNECENK